MSVPFGHANPSSGFPDADRFFLEIKAETVARFRATQHLPGFLVPRRRHFPPSDIARASTSIGLHSGSCRFEGPGN